MRCYKCFKFVLDIISISRCHHNNNGNNKHNSLSFQLDCILKECLEASLKCSQRDQKGQFHQHANAQLLRAQILKAQKAAWLDCLFCTFGIWARKACWWNWPQKVQKKKSLGTKLQTLNSARLKALIVVETDACSSG